MFSSKSDSDLPRFSISGVNIGYLARKFAHSDSDSDPGEETTPFNRDDSEQDADETGDLGDRIREAWTSMHVVQNFKKQINRWVIKLKISKIENYE